MAINDNEKRINEMNNKISTCEFDAETGTYLEDVHGNDFIGKDVDGDGLIDDVEKLVEEYREKADAYNAEQNRVHQENIQKEENEIDNNKNDNVFELNV